VTATGPGRPAAAGAPSPAASGPAPSSAWAPFRHRLFALMWGAQFVSNTGSWMQTVAAQWLMLSLTTSATYVALVQTAASLPVVLFAVLAGTIGDLVDRRKFLLITQAIMLIAAAALGALTIAGLITTWTLLALLFAVGTGQALTSPTWQTLQPELVSPDERPQAISLGAVNQNLARAVGPAIGGVILAATNAGTVFLINAISFAAVIGVVFLWRSSRPASALPREHVGEAVRAGGRYVAASPVLRVILIRAGLFIFFASAIWALLPLTARSALHLGSGGYGLLLAAVGVGALAGAGLLPRLRGRLTPGVLLGTGSAGMAVVALVLAYVHVTAVVAIALAGGGGCWILALSTLNTLYQLSLPPWVKARGLSFYLVVFQGGSAIGSAVMGVSAQYAGLSVTLLIAAIGLAAGPLAALRWRFQVIAPEDLRPAGDWPAPLLAGGPGPAGTGPAGTGPDSAGPDSTGPDGTGPDGTGPDGTAPAGPVQVTIEYHALPGRQQDLLAALRATRFSRRRTGATSWRAWQDAADPDRILEQFVVSSWAEHERQHERVTQRDQDRLNRARALSDPARPPAVTHWLAAG
jgi:predicted MFS family arabinose efflux permease